MLPVTSPTHMQSGRRRPSIDVIDMEDGTIKPVFHIVEEADSISPVKVMCMATTVVIIVLALAILSGKR